MIGKANLTSVDVCGTHKLSTASLAVDGRSVARKTED
jgi:hypothetical protein